MNYCRGLIPTRVGARIAFGKPASAARDDSELIKPEQRLQAHLKRGASYPPPYPNGWYKVADSDSLKAGDIKKLSCLGHELVLFRTNDAERTCALQSCACSVTLALLRNCRQGVCIGCVLPAYGRAFG